jgi:hypothetical protein
MSFKKLPFTRIEKNLINCLNRIRKMAKVKEFDSVEMLGSIDEVATEAIGKAYINRFNSIKKVR